MSEPYYRVPIDLTHPGRRAISRGVGTAAGAAGAEADGQPSSTPTGPVSQRQFIILAPAMAVTLVLLSPTRLVVGYTTLRRGTCSGVAKRDDVRPPAPHGGVAVPETIQPNFAPSS